MINVLTLAFAALLGNSFISVLGCITSWFSTRLFLLHFARKSVLFDGKKLVSSRGGESAAF